MADIGVGKYLTEPNHDVKILNLQCQIQERKSRIARLKQDIEDLKEMAIKAKEAEVKMLEADLNELNNRLSTIGAVDAVVIDVK